MKYNNQRELQNIVINHSADIGYEDLMKIYRERTKESYPFLKIDTTLPASDPLRFRINLFLFYRYDSNWSNQDFRPKKLSKMKHSMI